MTRTDAPDPRLLDALADAWERGWRPADVVHAVARAIPPLTGFVASAVLASVAALRAPAGLPPEWARQVAEVRTRGAAARADRAPTPSSAPALLLLIVQRLPPMPGAADPPSRWASAPPRPAGSASTAADRALGRIRALLAKAESTEFPEEAEALTAKAQELMTRHALDNAVADARHSAESGRTSRLAGDVVSRRVHLESPYLTGKVRLLSRVGSSNGVRVVWHSRHAISTAVGMPADLDLVDLLFTSLLVQATRAMAAAGRAGGPSARSSSFRRAFLLSYADRIGERLADARTAATTEAEQQWGRSLVPVLHDREEAVARAFTQLFPRVAPQTVRVSNAQGWHAGRRAADDADLSSGRGEVTD